jgi:hypothetical protein
MNALTVFNGFYDKFRTSDLWINMLNTRENSPWHREENVAEHTRMVIDWYKRALLKNRGERQQMLTLLACLFHDVGKPECETRLYHPDIGAYRSYAGHSKASAKQWLNFAMSESNVSALQPLELDADDVANIALMIEYHAPFKMELDAMVELKRTMLARMGESGVRAWLDFLLADQYGRHADRHFKDIVEVSEWVCQWEEIKF